MALEAIDEFASIEPFRSARADEIDIETSFFRRPLRAEDFAGIDFSQPVSADSATSLRALTIQRLLLCMNEVEMVRPSRPAMMATRSQRAAFYSLRTRDLAARSRPCLELSGLGFLEAAALEDGTIESPVLARAMQDEIEASRAFWNGLLRNLAAHEYLADGVRFILIQKACLLRARVAAITGAAAAGFFDGLDAGERPGAALSSILGQGLFARAESLDLRRCEHSYWQFYLATSLAEANLLYALRREPHRPARLTGAAFHAEMECAVLSEALADAGPVDVARCSSETHMPEKILARARRALAQLIANEGSDAAGELAAGWRMGRAAAACSRDDINQQLSWLARIPDSLRLARDLQHRIETQHPDIARETFDEPREMCSTTHIHDDHRLVAIESGRMVFWANLGMQLRLGAGEVLYVPKGRLHGSTVETASCLYHQPILPERWVVPHLGWRRWPR